MASPHIAFRAIPPMDAALQSRTRHEDARGLSEVARRDLIRYHALMATELARVAAQLTPGEAALIVDALRGTLFDDQLIEVRHLDHGIEDAITLDGLDTKWEVDGPKLLKVIGGWTIGQRMAVCDAAERFWVTAGSHQEHEVALRAVGLLPAEPRTALTPEGGPTP